ncbi:MAG: hypothetical protein J6U86_04385 [Clostridia bacterium]|nr:hypothetical protein [Clostridia bacterium]
MLELIEKKCAWCGRVFYPAYNHAFVEGHKDGRPRFYFCKYTCMLRYREDKAKRRKYRKRDTAEN